MTIRCLAVTGGGRVSPAGLLCTVHTIIQSYLLIYLLLPGVPGLKICMVVRRFAPSQTVRDPA